MVILGLYSAGGQAARQLARRLARARVEQAVSILTSTGCMWEKFSCQAGHRAGGGEYDTQTGFGWTNGALLDIINSLDCF